MFSRLFNRRVRTTPDEHGLCAPALRLSPKTAISLSWLFSGCFVAGMTGGGKSSTTPLELARSFVGPLKMGGLVVSVKSERQMWETICREFGRLDDLVVFGADQQAWRFDPILHEASRQGRGAGLTENIVHMLTTLIATASRESGRGGGQDNDAYWRNSCRQLLRNGVDLQLLAEDRVTVPDLYRIVLSAPRSMEQVRSEEWRKSSYCFQCLDAANRRLGTARRAADFEAVSDYFVIEFPQLNERTRSVIISQFSATCDCLQRGLLRELFSSGGTITPEACEAGKIILVDLPVKEFGFVGLLANMIWRLSFQRSIERRDLSASPRPVFLFQDEGHFFLHNEDSLWQATVRSSRVATVLITQNIPNLDVALGKGETGRAEAESLLANFGTLVFHCNTCQRTNQFASELLGKSRRLLMNGNTNYPSEPFGRLLPGPPDGAQISAGFSESLEYMDPATFSRYRTGGPDNGWLVDALVVQSGAMFEETGNTWMPVTFRQRH